MSDTSCEVLCERQSTSGPPQLDTYRASAQSSVRCIVSVHYELVDPNILRLQFSSTPQCDPHLLPRPYYFETGSLHLICVPTWRSAFLPLFLFVCSVPAHRTTTLPRIADKMSQEYAEEEEEITEEQQHHQEDQEEATEAGGPLLIAKLTVKLSHTHILTYTDTTRKRHAEYQHRISTS